jgi:hypothetical protein
MITSNLVLSKRDQIFEDLLTTAAPVDRVVHDSVSWNSMCRATGVKLPKKRDVAKLCELRLKQNQTRTPLIAGENDLSG